MRGWAAVVSLFLIVPVAGQAGVPAARTSRGGVEEPSLDVVLARVAEYVADYQKRLVGIVAEEHYRQNVQNVSRGGRTTRQFRELKSDVLLVKHPTEDRWLQFRDVFEVDRKPVRDRDERLYKLFVTPTATTQSQAQAIQDESARYNIGPVQRTVNVPILGLLFFGGRIQQELKVERLEAGNLKRFAGLALPENIWRIGFKEIGSPTLIRGANDGDLRSTGEIWIDRSTGCILRTEVVSQDANLHAEIEVSYRVAPGLTLLVPADMREVYRVRINESRIDGRAEYSKFRQFTVTTTEKPKP